MTLSTDPYKGVRDFYPEDKRIQQYIFDTWKSVVERYGYDQYDASTLEPSELYEAKSGQEIVDNETYSFIDRGNRRVTLRPEMTPTVARMVAKKKRELAFPLRWYSIPNLFRYERPQRGRLREHWQLNVDLFGDTGIDGDAELIAIGYDILLAFGLTKQDFTIRINDRALIKELFERENISGDTAYQLQKLIDKKNKIPDFDDQAQALLGRQFNFDLSPNEQIEKLIERLDSKGITNVKFSSDLMRGFDYYTGTVFEFFDNHPDNNRSLFGGGRYDNLLDIFGSDRVSAVGFGAGDVGMRNVLETYNLLPQQTRSKPAVGICLVDEEAREELISASKLLRDSTIIVSVNTTLKNPRNLIEWSQKSGYDFTILIGEREASEKIYTIRNNKTKISSSIISELVPSWVKQEWRKDDNS